MAWLRVASVGAMESIEAFIDRLPKVELHLHLVGSASVPTVLELARRHPDGGVPQSAAELAAFYEFRDFPHFADVYAAVSGLVREPADVAELVLGAARDLAGQNVRYAELTVTPYTFTAFGMAVADLTEALDIAARSALSEHGVRPSGSGTASAAWPTPPYSRGCGRAARVTPAIIVDIYPSLPRVDVHDVGLQAHLAQLAQPWGHPVNTRIARL